jgi:hypothetical protein
VVSGTRYPVLGTYLPCNYAKTPPSVSHALPQRPRIRIPKEPQILNVRAAGLGDPIAQEVDHDSDDQQ